MNIHVAQRKVSEFHEVKLPKGVDPRHQVVKLMEEVGELAAALLKNDQRGVADGLADSFYVLLGIANLTGVDLETAFIDVHHSNMTKLPSGGINPTKGAGFQEPKL